MNQRHCGEYGGGKESTDYKIIKIVLPKIVKKQIKEVSLKILRKCDHQESCEL